MYMNIDFVEFPARTQSEIRTKYQRNMCDGNIDGHWTCIGKQNRTRLALARCLDMSTECLQESILIRLVLFIRKMQYLTIMGWH